MVYSENLEGNPDVNPGEGETARETARFFLCYESILGVATINSNFLDFHIGQMYIST